MTQLTKKVCLLGDFSVGKTSLARRFAENRFDDSYLSTIGVRVSRKLVQLRAPAPLALAMLIWDTAGSEAFSEVVRAYYRGASGGLLVCDLTRPETAIGLRRYVADFRGVNPGAPLVLVGNKVDLAGRRAVPDDLLAEIAALADAPCLLASAKTGVGVDPAFQALGEAICYDRHGE